MNVTTFTQQMAMYIPGMTETEGSILSTVLSKTLFPRDRVFRNCFSSSLITSITWKMHTRNHVSAWEEVTTFVHLTLHHATLTPFNDWWIQIHVCIYVEAIITLPLHSPFFSLSLPRAPPSLLPSPSLSTLTRFCKLACTTNLETTRSISLTAHNDMPDNYVGTTSNWWSVN